MIQNKKLIIACNNAIDMFPYYSPGLSRARYKQDDSIGTLGTTNRLVISYNKKFVDGLDINDLAVIETHEILHVINDHHHRWRVNPRFGKISHTIANIAMDIEINQYLVKDSDWIRDTGWIPEKVKLPEGKSFEFYLEALLNNMQNRKNGQDFGDPKVNQTYDDLNEHQDTWEKVKSAIEDALSKSVNNLDMSGSDENDDEVSEEIQDIINEIRAKQQGQGSEFSDIVRNVPKKAYNWKDVLKSVIRTKVDSLTRGRDYSTYLKPNNSVSSKGIIFPSKYSYEYSVNIVVGIDVSGSMGDLVNEMYSRLKSIDRAMSNANSFTVVECNTDVTNVMVNFKPCENAFKSTDGGGTDMEAIPKWVKKMVDAKKMREPDLIVIMTDNYCSWDSPENHPYHKKTVVLTNNLSEDCTYKQYEVSLD